MPRHDSVVPHAAEIPVENTLPYPNDGRPYLLIVGSRAGIKNFSTLLDALSRTGLLNLCDLIAFGGGILTPIEQEKIQSLGIQQSSLKQFTGNDTLLASLYKVARFFIYPSIYEGFGLPPLEALAAGCPVASSNTSSMPEVLGDAVTYFNPNDPSEMATVMTELFHKGAKRDQFIQKGLVRASLYSWEKTAKLTMDVYRKTISNKLS